jgi:hypothetical protein
MGVNVNNIIARRVDVSVVSSVPGEHRIHAEVC